jgi:hypothetical protein
MNHREFFVWDPMISVGPFKFDADIQTYLKKYDLQLVEEATEPVNWDTYADSEENIYISTENSKIISIASYKHLFYEGVDLIGMSFEEIKDKLGEPNKIDNSIGDKIPVEYYGLGLEIWLRDNQVSDITLNGFIED